MIDNTPSVPSDVLQRAANAQFELMLREKEQREQEEGFSSDDDERRQAGARLAPKSFLNDPFMLLDQLGLNYRTTPSTLTFETLRMMTEKNVIVSAVIQTRIMQMYAACQQQRNKYSVGFQVSHLDPTKRLNTEEKSVANYIIKFILNCGETHPYGRDTFDTYIKKTVRDRLTYDQTATEVVNKYNGKPYEFTHVPADTVRLRRLPLRSGRPQRRSGVAPLATCRSSMASSSTTTPKTR
jgi:hypothetical protein